MLSTLLIEEVVVMSYVLVFLAAVIVSLLAMIAAGDLRVTSKQQREWEARWQRMGADERERIARLTWS